MLALTMLLGPAAPAEGSRYLDPMFSVTAERDVVYGRATNAAGAEQDLLLDLYAPAGDVETARPAIVFAHGGGFTGGSRTEDGIVELAEAFAARGYVTASISYRVDPDLGYEELIVGSLAGEMPRAMRDAQHDMQAAVRWMRANAVDLGIDPDLIVAGGISAGASMALETAYNPDDPGASNDLDVSSEVAAAISSSGATDPRRIEGGRPPVMMFNGTNDTTAPYPLAVAACSVALARGNVCVLNTFFGEGHNLRPQNEAIIATSAAFLCLHVVDC